MSGKKGILVFVVLCAAVLIGVGIFTANIKKEQVQKPQSKSTVKVSRKDIYDEITLRGIVTSEERPVFCNTTARVKKVFIEENEFVKKGDIIALLDDSRIKSKLERKEKEKRKLAEELGRLQAKLRSYMIYSHTSGQVQEVYVKEADIVPRGTPICKVVRQGVAIMTVAFPKWLFDSIKESDSVKVILPEFGQEMKGYVRAKSRLFYTEQSGIPVFDVEITVAAEDVPLNTKGYAVFTLRGQDVRSLSEGILTALEDIIKSPVDGTVKKIYISRFSHIDKNQLVAELSSDEILEQIETKEEQIEQVSQEINEYKKELDKFVIKASSNGIINDITITEGKIVNEGEKIASIWDPADLVFESRISELEIDRIKRGQKVTLEFKVPGKVGVREIVDATVESVGSKPFEESQDLNVSFYPIKIKFKSDKVKRGMHATVKINALIKKNVLCVPVEALHEENGKYYVWVEKETQTDSVKTAREEEKDKIADELGTRSSYYKNAEKREVVIGISNKWYAEILGGLKEGEKVVLPEAYKVEDTKQEQGGR